MISFSKIFKRCRKHICIIVITAMAAYIISSFYCQFMIIQGESMYPSYQNLQLVLLNKHTKDLQAGDVIAFRCDTAKALLVKRIAAVPGDTVLIRKGILYVNGRPNTGIWAKGNISYAGIAKYPVMLSDQEYFVLGDNITYSKDSRYKEIGCVKSDSVVGKVIC